VCGDVVSYHAGLVFVSSSMVAGTPRPSGVIGRFSLGDRWQLGMDKRGLTGVVGFKVLLFSSPVAELVLLFRGGWH
jgi:hypothetical protein